MKRFHSFSDSRAPQAVVVLAAALFFVGCGPSIPDIVPVSGTVKVDGKPIGNVEVRFIPTQEGLDGNMVGSGVTDKNGFFTLYLPGRDEPGACAGESKITVREGPIPDSIRGGANEQMAATEFMASLKNRPIPKEYQRMGNTPLTIVVTAGQTDYPLELKR